MILRQLRGHIFYRQPMANNRKISELQLISNPASADLYYVIQNGALKTCTHTLLRTTAIARFGVYVSHKDISSTNIKLLYTNGTTLVASGNQYIPMYVIVSYDRGATPYDTNTSMYIDYGGAVSSTVNFEVGADTIFVLVPDAGNYDSTADIKLKVATGNPINGTGTMHVVTVYKDI